MSTVKVQTYKKNWSASEWMPEIVSLGDNGYSWWDDNPVDGAIPKWRLDTNLNDIIFAYDEISAGVQTDEEKIALDAIEMKNACNNLNR